MSPSKAKSWWNKVLFSSEEYLKARFDAGEESGCKADPEHVTTDMRNARNKDNVAVEKPNPSILFEAICFKEKARQCFNASTSSTG